MVFSSDSFVGWSSACGGYVFSRHYEGGDGSTPRRACTESVCGGNKRQSTHVIPAQAGIQFRRPCCAFFCFLTNNSDVHPKTDRNSFFI